MPTRCLSYVLSAPCSQTHLLGGVSALTLPLHLTPSKLAELALRSRRVRQVEVLVACRNGQHCAGGIQEGQSGYCIRHFGLLERQMLF